MSSSYNFLLITSFMLKFRFDNFEKKVQQTPGVTSHEKVESNRQTIAASYPNAAQLIQLHVSDSVKDNIPAANIVN